MGSTVSARRLISPICSLRAMQMFLLGAAFAANCLATEYPPPPGPYRTIDASPEAPSQSNDHSHQTSKALPKFRDPITNPSDKPPDLEPPGPQAVDKTATQDQTRAPSKSAPQVRRAATSVTPPPTPAWPPALGRPAPSAFAYGPPPMPRPGRQPFAPVPGFHPPPFSYPPIYRPAPAKPPTSSAPPKPAAKATVRQDGSHFSPPTAPAAKPRTQQTPSISESVANQDTSPSPVSQENGEPLKGGGLSQFRPPDLKGTR